MGDLIFLCMRFSRGALTSLRFARITHIHRSFWNAEIHCSLPLASYEFLQRFILSGVMGDDKSTGNGRNSGSSYSDPEQTENGIPKDKVPSGPCSTCHRFEVVRSVLSIQISKEELQRWNTPWHNYSWLKYPTKSQVSSKTDIDQGGSNEIGLLGPIHSSNPMMSVNRIQQTGYH